MVTFVELEIGTGGVCPCTRCGVTPPAPLPYQEIESKLDAVAQMWFSGPGPNVSLAGFEPFAHPQLPAIIAAAARCGFERIRLTTDAGALSQPGNAAGVISAGVRHLEVVLLGAGDTHDALSGRTGLFEAARAGVAAFGAQAAGMGERIAVSGAVPLCRHTVAHAGEAVAALAAMGASAVHLDASRLSSSEVNARLVEAACETATVNRVAAFVTGWDAELDRSYTTAPWRLEKAGNL